MIEVVEMYHLALEGIETAKWHKVTQKVKGESGPNLIMVMFSCSFFLSAVLKFDF